MDGRQYHCVTGFDIEQRWYRWQPPRMVSARPVIGHIMTIFSLYVKADQPERSGIVKSKTQFAAIFMLIRIWDRRKPSSGMLGRRWHLLHTGDPRSEAGNDDGLHVRKTLLKHHQLPLVVSNRAFAFVESESKVDPRRENSPFALSRPVMEGCMINL